MKDVKFIVESDPQDKPPAVVGCFLERCLANGVTLRAIDPDKRIWSVCTLKNNGTLYLHPNLPEEYFDVDEDGEIELS